MTLSFYEAAIRHGLGLTDADFEEIGSGAYGRVFLVSGPSVKKAYRVKDVVVKFTLDKIDAAAAWRLSKTPSRKYTKNLPKVHVVYGLENMYVIATEWIPYVIGEAIRDSFEFELLAGVMQNIRYATRLAPIEELREEAVIVGADDSVMDMYIESLRILSKTSREWYEGTIDHDTATKNVEKAMTGIVKAFSDWDRPIKYPRAELALIGIAQGMIDLIKYAQIVMADLHPENVMLRHPKDPVSVCIIDFGISSIPQHAYDDAIAHIEALRVRAANVARHIPKLRVWRR